MCSSKADIVDLGCLLKSNFDFSLGIFRTYRHKLCEMFMLNDVISNTASIKINKKNSVCWSRKGKDNK